MQPDLLEQHEQAPEQQAPEQHEQAPERQDGPQRRKLRRARTLVMLALLVTFTALVVGLVVFIEPASGATGGCGG